jgi:hypothetical protein
MLYWHSSNSQNDTSYSHTHLYTHIYNSCTIFTVLNHTQKPTAIKGHYIWPTAAFIWYKTVTLDVTATKCTRDIYIQYDQHAAPCCKRDRLLVWHLVFKFLLEDYLLPKYLQFTTSINPTANLQQTPGHDTITKGNFALSPDVLCCFPWTTRTLCIISLF